MTPADSLDIELPNTLVFKVSSSSGKLQNLIKFKYLRSALKILLKFARVARFVRETFHIHLQFGVRVCEMTRNQSVETRTFRKMWAERNCVSGS